MFKVKYVDSIMMLVRLDLNLIVSLFQHKCEVSETVSTTTLVTSRKAKWPLWLGGGREAGGGRWEAGGGRREAGGGKGTTQEKIRDTFFLISGFCTNLPLPHNFPERSHQGLEEVACIVSKPLVSCLWGCGAPVNPPKLNIQEVQGGLCPLDQRETPGLLPIFQDFLLLSNHTPLDRSHREIKTLFIFLWIKKDYNM